MTWVNDRAYRVLTPELEFYHRRLKLTIDGQSQHFRLQNSDNSIITAYCGTISQLDIFSPKEWELAHFMPPVQGPEETGRALLVHARAGGGPEGTSRRPRVPEPGPGDHRFYEDGVRRFLTPRRRREAFVGQGGPGRGD
ncbi:hypothetical protein DFAR_720004 [Desulfarculales bacterium]